MTKEEYLHLQALERYRIAKMVLSGLVFPEFTDLSGEEYLHLQILERYRIAKMLLSGLVFPEFTDLSGHHVDMHRRLDHMIWTLENNRLGKE